MRSLLLLPLFALLLALVRVRRPRRGPRKKTRPSRTKSRLKNAFQGTDGASLVEFLAPAPGATGPGEARRADRGPRRQGRLGPPEGVRRAGRASVPRRCPRSARRPATSTPPTAAALARRCLAAPGRRVRRLTAAAVRLLRRPPARGHRRGAPRLPAARRIRRRRARNSRPPSPRVAFDKGKPDPAPAQGARATSTPSAGPPPSSRSARRGQAEPRAALRKLLADPSPSVRYQASLALARANDAKAVSTLVTLLADLPVAQAREVETFLKELAGDLAAQGRPGRGRRRPRQGPRRVGQVVAGHRRARPARRDQEAHPDRGRHRPRREAHREARRRLLRDAARRPRRRSRRWAPASSRC